jgi:hypothetical protein
MMCEEIMNSERHSFLTCSRFLTTGDLFQPPGVDLICLSISAPFTHEDFECGYLGLKAATAALHGLKTSQPSA